MTHTHSISRRTTPFIVALLFVFIPTVSFALTPIARWDTVPHQRITKGETFNLGVVAFSKAGIDKVEFAITGQGYSGTNPLQSSSMTYNSRTDVYEYWVPLKVYDFATDGVFYIQATVYGKDGGKLDMETLPLVVNATGNLPQPKAWVSTTGNDGAGVIGTISKPFATVGGAVSAIQAVNGSSSDGAIIYFFEGTYDIGNGSTNTTNEWLTLTRDANASKNNTIIEDSGSVVDTNMIKINGLTLMSNRSGDKFFSKRPAILWINDCRIIGSGRYVAGSNPAYRGGSTAEKYPSYFTNSYIYNVDYGMHRGILARGLTIERVGNDPFVNVLCVINARVDDVDPGSTYWHADGYQSWGDGPENRIIYNYYGTNLHYQGLFLREENNTPANNNAFINIFMEMRKPGRPGSPGKKPTLTNGAIYGVWNHVLMWHCTFPSSHFSINSEAIGHKFADSSFIGNVFFEYRDYVTGSGPDPSYSLPGNANNNDFLYNHFIWSCVDQGDCGSYSPHWHSKSPDSDPKISQTIGDPKIDLADSASDSFGIPLQGSVLVNRIPFVTVPADARGNPRDLKPDVGALEKVSIQSSMSTPTGLRLF